MKQIPLTRGHFALVDDDDYDYLMQWKWHSFFNDHTNTYYAARRQDEDGKRKTIFMHKILLNSIGRQTFVDHKDHDTLNNQRSNLRLATYSQNSANRKSKNGASSKYLGVYWHKYIGKWYCNIKKEGITGGKQMHIGYFDNEEDAAKAYDEKAKEFHKEFANLNFKTA